MIKRPLLPLTVARLPIGESGLLVTVGDSRSGLVVVKMITCSQVLSAVHPVTGRR